MQLLIVDDEAHWVDNLSQTKPWHTLGIQSVHKAYSSYEALDIIGSYPIDIVISDILMPEMTGLELFEHIRRTNRKIRFILLSGHSDFDFTQQAVRYQAVDYLLKPPTDEELLGSVQTAITQLRQEWATIGSMKKTQMMFRENLPLLRGQLLLDALNCRLMHAEEWGRKLEEYLLPIRHGEDSALLLVRLEEEFGQYKNKDLHLLEYAIMNIAEELTGEIMEIWSVKDKYDYLVLLVQMNDPTTEIDRGAHLQQLAMQLQHNVKQYLKGAVSIVTTDWFTFPQQLSTYYQQAAAGFRRLVGNEREFVLQATDRREASCLTALEALYVPPSLIHLLEAGRWDAVEDKLARVLDELDERWTESWEHCMEAGYRIASSFSHLAHKNGKSLQAILGADFEPLSSGETFRSIGRLRKWTQSALEKLKQASHNEIKAHRSFYVEKLQMFVEQNLHRDVSLRTMADHLSLHPTHLSKIYKLETGEGISDYVFRLRMERACHLLTTTDKKVYEIGSEIGYWDPAYFIKVFKRQFSVTPQEYRDCINSTTDSYAN